MALLPKEIMHNNTIKNTVKRSKISRSKQIEAAQAEWLKEAEQVADEKAAIGYEAFSWDAFLDVAPEYSSDIAMQSKIIDLQCRYKELVEQQKLLWAEDNVINELNKIHAVVHPNQTYILTEKINTFGDKDFSLESRQSFKAFYEDEMILCIDGIERSKADLWLKNPKRRKYKDIIFDPTTTESKEHYNLWKGFTRTPKNGDCSKYWDHVKNNICDDNQELYIYVRKWVAYVFQYPAEVHTALVLCGSQGVGKNSFVEPLGVLLGSHFAPLSSLHELVSNFNYHLKNAVLIHANEALWGGNKKELGTIKAMITDHTCLIEGKGKDSIVVQNCKHAIFTSNEDWPVHIDPDDRRFVTMLVSEKHKEDHAYFEAIQEELDNGGYEALLYDLLNEDFTKFNPRKMPSSADSFEIKLRSAESPHRYIYAVLSEGRFSIGNALYQGIAIWPETIPKDAAYKDYVEWCQNNGEQALSKELFGRIIKKVIASISDIRLGGESRVRCYQLPSLQKTQEEFCKAFKEDPERIFDNYEVTQMTIQS